MHRDRQMSAEPHQTVPDQCSFTLPARLPTTTTTVLVQRTVMKSLEGQINSCRCSQAELLRLIFLFSFRQRHCSLAIGHWLRIPACFNQLSTIDQLYIFPVLAVSREVEPGKISPAFPRRVEHTVMPASAGPSSAPRSGCPQILSGTIIEQGEVEASVL